MKHLSITLLAVLLFAGNLSAKDYSSLYNNLPVKINQVSAPVIPKLTVNIKDYGAKGDGVTLCSEAFKKAIEDLNSKGGGHLNVPAGIWLTGPIVFKNNIDLHLDENAIIQFSPNKKDFQNDVKRMIPCISGKRCSNISITGTGTLDGNGQYWRYVKRMKQSDVEWNEYLKLGGEIDMDNQMWYPYNLKHFDNLTKSAKKEENLRNDLIRFEYCKNILIQDVTVQNSPRFHVHPCYCSNVIIDGIKVRCPWNAQNGDGIDFANCKVGLITGCSVDVGDDGICMKAGVAQAGKDKGSVADILIESNKVYHAHGGFVLGSDIAGGMERVVCRNCTFSNTDTGLRFKSAVDRGGKISDLFCQNIVMNNIKTEAITFSCNYNGNPDKIENFPKDSEGKFIFVPDFTDIHISNIVCRGCSTGIYAKGVDGYNAVHDIDITNCVFFYNDKDKDIDETTAKLTLKDVKFVTFDK